MHSTKLKGARTHNLKGIDLELAPSGLTVVAGPSGAGKSSLVFGTLYAEGQRRYVESFSAYARQFLERLPRPPVDELEPVPPAISVDRQGTIRTSRSTVASMTEVADYAKGLWARLATLRCPTTGEAIVRDEPEHVADALLERHPDAKAVVTFPVALSDAEAFIGVRDELTTQGYQRILHGDGVAELNGLRPSEVLGEPLRLKHTHQAERDGVRSLPVACDPVARGPQLNVVLDRLVLRKRDRSRLVEALEAGMRRGDGRVDVQVWEGPRLAYSRGLHCARCDQRFRDPSPGLFSFNSPIGACPTCKGFGRVIAVDWEKVIPDHDKTLAGGAIRAWTGKSAQWERRELKKHAKKAKVPLDVPFKKLTAAQRTWLFDGDKVGWPRGWGGLRGWFKWMESRAYKMHVRVFLARYRKYDPCEDCNGTRFKPDALRYLLEDRNLLESRNLLENRNLQEGRSIADFLALSCEQALSFVRGLPAPRAGDTASALLIKECAARLEVLCQVGLGYLTLDRAVRSLSGGELQRVALTSALGSSLTGALFALDEPTYGLHPRDVGRLARVVGDLARAGNAVVAVEHDTDFIRQADRVIELGPDAGERGGEVVFDGTPEALAREQTATGLALRGGMARSREPRALDKWLTLEGARGHNLQDVTLRIPHAALTCVTGVSGSGKSSLITQTLVPAVARKAGASSERPLAFAKLLGATGLHAVLHVDQSPLGRTSRGNSATYLKIWEVIRKRYASEPLARERDYGPGTFSANVAGGRCEVCKGQGFETVEMQFLADVTFSCAACGGQRFVGGVLDIQHRGLNIAQVLELTVQEALALYADDREVVRRLRALSDVGLTYIRLGQPLNTLSGGEGQRLKLAAALEGRRKRSLIVLDEPSAGLHARDVEPLLERLHALVDAGDTVVLVEHDMSVAAQADYVIDLGPGAGAHGGRVVAEGRPSEVAKTKGSETGPFLSAALKSRRGSKTKVNGRRANGQAIGAKLNGKHAKSVALKATQPRQIGISGAREHNLREVDLTLPLDRLVVVTGRSGSGKSSLAFDVLFAEGQRRFLETLSPYARQYLPQLPRPNVDSVTGVPPTVSLEQRLARGGANSTVATVTETAHFLRLLYARVGVVPADNIKVGVDQQEPAALVGALRREFGRRARVSVWAPIIQGRKGHHRELLDRAQREGFAEARIDGEVRPLREGMGLERYKEHDIDLLVARLKMGDAELGSAIRKAAERAGGEVRILVRKHDRLFAFGGQKPVSVLDPRLFSFNTRQGACASCEGRGYLEREVGRGRRSRVERATCSDCEGTRLGEFARSILVASRPITEHLACSVSEARQSLGRIKLAGRAAVLGKPLLQELDRRLAFLEEVGVGYLGLDRSADTLSGGELQRVRLAAQLGSGLTGVLYVLDEPTIGLHPRDTGRLLTALRRLVDQGNSVVVVEHDLDTIEAADEVIDMGPGGGHLGGRVVARGTPTALRRNPKSITGCALAHGPALIGKARPTRSVDWIELKGASANNLRDVDMRVPVGRLIAVTGVSGSGKSTLVREVFLRAVRQELGLVTDAPGGFRAIRGGKVLKRAVEVDQTPIGRTPRSVPATYIGVWDLIRKLLAGTAEARQRGYSPSRFSFNVAQGRCPDCGGNGALTVEMSFLPDAFLPCESCDGKRFTRETLAVKLHGLSAGEILELEIDEAAEIFSSVSRIADPLRLLSDLGLGYLKLGQASNTLSGGEAQRLKLVAELSAGASGPTLYVLDEPTTGLHREDVTRLITLVQRFVERGDTVVVIEHQLDLIAASDWVIDLGPEGGSAGGRIIAAGPPSKIAQSKRSHTGAALRAEAVVSKPGRTRSKQSATPPT